MSTKEWWVAWFDARFGHGYYQLNKKYRQMHFEQCANEMLIMESIYLEKIAELEAVLLQAAKERTE